jgi:hypothetical protein
METPTINDIQSVNSARNEAAEPIRGIIVSMATYSLGRYRIMAHIIIWLATRGKIEE